MTLEEKKIKVALKVGYKHAARFPDPDVCLWIREGDPHFCRLPNWPGSLDAMHELECFLVTDDDTCHQYAIFLEDIVQKWMLKHPQE